MPPTTRARYLADTLEVNRIDAVFLAPPILSKTLYEMENRTAVRRNVTHGEKAAAYLADGYARASGRPRVAMAQTVG